MKILWITSVYPSSLKPGEGVFHETQVQELQKLGLDITVICPRPFHSAPVRMLKKAYRKKDARPEYEIRKGVPVHRPFYRAVPGQLKWAQPHRRIASAVLKTMKQRDIHPDLIHAHFAMPSGGAAAVVSESERIPYVLTLHGSDVNVYPHYSKGAFKAFNRAVGSASAVLAVSHKLQEETKTLSGFDSSVLPIGIQLSRFQENEQTKEEIRKKLGLPLDQRLAVYVGRLVREKGIFELSEAIESLKEPPKAVFVGDGPAKSLLIQKGHIVTGQVPNHKVRDYLLAADMFVLPSYSEGMPTVVIEALALRVPVICTDVGGVASLFGKHQHLLIKPKSAQALAEAITLYEHEQIWKPEVADDLYEIVQAQFDAGKNAKALHHQYQTVMKTSV
ncbi:teichuronic acid biosynthesis protein TuaC [Bacillus inaquosorum]|uniref:teichuronic acid biosynthesis protein TuaC n=1 Tax=Bacillus inaquosorum TaxID=483913 RepID=UPI000745EF4C|nr:glycosyltransferase family 4 protein [Bacillus inaquosorum]PPA35458.1 glycosyltransferase family 4 protein [Bacillus subtilis]AMA54055.1 glycosyl transferase family 1 [Bacillus inaquosorum]MBT2193109.1 glycosyltransferase family 4 protein [Bacillus inaquosorum]MBT3119841.1 glycosyltransferase family 4 protein [Bacillus inaquosorum]MBT3124333.1 glycosyltransferase family 4 protein [Bacillus inaquosorum]